MKRWAVAAVVALQHAVLTITRARENVEDPDGFWIAAAGRDMLRSGHFPRENAYSFVDGAHPWTMHEHLYGPPTALGLGAWGPAFFLAFGIVSASLAVALVTTTVLASSKNTVASLATIFGILVAVEARLGYARPTWSSLVFALAMAAIAFRKPFTWMSVAAAVGTELVWANAHGSFPVGVALLAAAALEERSRERFVALGGAALATFANPYGAGVHALVLAYASGARGDLAVMHRWILEYSPITKAAYFQITPVPLLVLAGAVTIVAAVSLARRELVVRSLFVLALVAAALLHARHVAYAGLLGAILLAPQVERFAERTLRVRDDEGPRAPPWRWALVAVVPGLVLGLAVVVSRAPSRDALLGDSMGGAHAAKLIRNLPEGAHVYVPFRTTGLAIWEGAPRGVKVLYDSRNDCYSPELTSFTLGINDSDEGTILRGFDRFGVDYAMTPSRAYVESADLFPRWKVLATLDRALSGSDAWAVRATSDGWLVYGRAK